MRCWYRTHSEKHHLANSNDGVGFRKKRLFGDGLRPVADGPAAGAPQPGIAVHSGIIWELWLKNSYPTHTGFTQSGQ